MDPAAHEELLRLRAEADGGNPFRLPANERALLEKGEVDRRRRQLERVLFRTLDVAEKASKATGVGAVRTLRDQAARDQLALVAPPRTSTVRDATSQRTPEPAETQEMGGSAFMTGVDVDERAPTPPVMLPKTLPKLEAPEAAKPLELENIRALVHKKRETFLVQMRLDVKRAEIMKLEEKARMKEQALKKSQAQIEEDITRFDSFLHANDNRALKKMKHAEECAKERQEMVQRIKNLKSMTAAVQSETGKLRESGDEAVRDKAFLERLTPQEWKDQQEQARIDRKNGRRDKWATVQLEANLVLLGEDIVAEEEKLKVQLEGMTRKMRRMNAKQAKEMREDIQQCEDGFETTKFDLARRYPSRAAIEAEYVDVDSDEEQPLYFQEPAQLVETFLALEEQNLFLIQNVQMTEHELEETERMFRSATTEIDDKCSALKHSTRKIRAQVKAEQQEIGRINTHLEKMSSAEQDKETKGLTSKISKAYNECLKDAQGGDPDTLQMLVSIEATLEELVEQLDRLRKDAPHLVTKLEKAIEKLRREHWRKLKLEEQRRVELSRQARLEEPVHVKIGKQLMFRSAKPQVKKVVVDTSEEEALKRDHDLFGVHLGKDGVHTDPPEIPPC